MKGKPQVQEQRSRDAGDGDGEGCVPHRISKFLECQDFSRLSRDCANFDLRVVCVCV